MKTLLAAREETVVLTAPRGGVVSLRAPAALCGELEVFEAGEAVACVGDEVVAAPGRGFVARAFVVDGALVRDGDPVVELRFA